MRVRTLSRVKERKGLSPIPKRLSMPKTNGAGQDISSSLKEERLFKPPKGFQKAAHIGSLAAYEALCRKSKKNPEKFWADLARELLTWFSPWKKVLIWKPPSSQWSVGGKLNVSVNC